MNRGLLKALESGPLRYGVAVARSVAQSVRHRTPVVLWPDAEGHWVNVQRAATIHSPVLFSAPYSWVLEEVRDLWCWAYEPRVGDVVLDVGAGVGDHAV